MGKALIDFGLQLGQQAAGGLMGMAFGGMNDRRQRRQQRKLMEMEIQGQKHMTDYNYGKQMQMWKDTNYSAQIEQLKLAGLNPALIYGMSGGGGATTNVETGRITGGQAAPGGGEIVGMANSAAQLGLMRAQKENIEADTANKKADIPVKGATVPKIEAETKSLLQGIDNAKAQKELTEVQTSLASIEEHIASLTQNQIVAKIGTELRELTAKMHIWERNNNIDEQTADEKIGIIEKELIGIGLRNALTKAQTGKTDEEIKQIVQQVQASIQGIKNETDRVKIEQQIANFETSFGKQVGGIIGSIINLLPFGKGERIPRGTKPPSVRGFKY